MELDREKPTEHIVSYIWNDYSRTIVNITYNQVFYYGSDQHVYESSQTIVNVKSDCMVLEFDPRENSDSFSRVILRPVYCKGTSAKIVCIRSMFKVCCIT